MIRTTGYISAAYAVALLIVLSPAAAWLWVPEPLLWGALAVTLPSSALMAWKLLPRPIAFTGPGIEAEAGAQPRLTEFLRRAAWLTLQPRPARVVLGLAADASAGVETNAWGLGARRLIVLGLPLLHVLSVAELTTVVCRQMSLFAGARAWRCAVLTHFTRSFRGWLGMARVASHVDRAKQRQYAAAREALIGVFGADSVEGAEDKAAAVSLLFPVYWDQDVAPALAAGLAPPLLTGFDRFVDALEPDRADVAHSRELLREGRFQQHPAASLLEDVEAVERSLLEGFAAARLQPVSWEEVGTRAYLEQWREVVSAVRSGGAAVTPDTLPEVARDPHAIGSRVLGAEADAGEARDAGHEVLAMFVASWLEQAGWAFDYRGPGDARTFSRGAETIDPSAVVSQLASGEVGAETWHDWCRRAGVAALPVAA